MKNIYEKLKFNITLMGEALRSITQTLKTRQILLSPVFKIVLGIEKTTVKSPEQNEQTPSSQKI